MSDKVVTFDQQLAEVQREIKVRERVYAKWIDNGTMRQETADQQMAALRAVLETLQELQEQQLMQPNGLLRFRTVEGMPS